MIGAVVLLSGAGLLAATSWDLPRSDRTTQVAEPAGHGSATVSLPAPVGEIRITPAKGPDRPLVLIDAGHGGRDPGASSASGEMREKQLTLLIARELRDRLGERGRVRVALTREDDRYLLLEQRARIASRLGADLFLSIHADSAPNPLARGATVYSLSDVASGVVAARLAQAQNAGQEPLAGAGDSSVPALLADLARRDAMQASAELADRLVRKAEGRVPLRPQPHQFASFLVLRSTAVPAVLVEVGYLSNVDDEAMLRSPEGRGRIVAALADAIESDLAVRGRFAAPKGSPARAGLLQ